MVRQETNTSITEWAIETRPLVADLWCITSKDSFITFLNCRDLDTRETHSQKSDQTFPGHDINKDQHNRLFMSISLFLSISLFDHHHIHMWYVKYGLYVITLIIGYIFIVVCHVRLIIHNQLSLCQLTQKNQNSLASLAPPNDRSLDEMGNVNVKLPFGFMIKVKISRRTGVDTEDRSVMNEASTSSERGLLSLPPELRVIIYRHLLVEGRPLSTYWRAACYEPFPAILDTCRLIRREAFQVLYGENVFFIGLKHPQISILSNRRIADTIQHVRYAVYLYGPSVPLPRRLNFLHLIHEFGSQAIIRDTLQVVFHVVVVGLDLPTPMRLYAAGLGRFTNFRTVRFEFVEHSDDTEGTCAPLAEMYELLLTPKFGPAESFANGCVLEFHPQDFLSSRSPDVDWMEHLDGIRQHW